MSAYNYSGLAAFGRDCGTFAGFDEDAQDCVDVTTLDDGSARREMKLRAKGYPIVWFVDDERANRQWFRDYHREDFATLTFSGRTHFRKAMARGLPCDAIVTDIFFPAKAVKTAPQADGLLSIYDTIAKTTVGKLPSLWKKQRAHWKLDGFSIAKDGALCKPQIPVFLFSRKALLLLNVDQLGGGPLVVGNSTWLIEKVAPTVPPKTARRAARLQCQRIYATLAHRRKKWHKRLDCLS